ncbi:MAG TPA: hypothetical protein VL122_06100 [Nitrospirota bacterium]|nr:hypothetical protein [Nitrospirota bacterium]
MSVKFKKNKKSKAAKVDIGPELVIDHDGPNCLSRRTFYSLYPDRVFAQDKRLRKLLKEGKFSEIRQKLFPFAVMPDDLYWDMLLNFSTLNSDLSSLSNRTKTDLFIGFDFCNVYPPPEIMHHIANALRAAKRGIREKDLKDRLGITGGVGKRSLKFKTGINVRLRLIMKEVHLLKNVYGCSIELAADMVCDRLMNMDDKDPLKGLIEKALKPSYVRTQYKNWKKEFVNDGNGSLHKRSKLEEKKQYLLDHYESATRWPKDYPKPHK